MCDPIGVLAAVSLFLSGLACGVVGWGTFIIYLAFRKD